MIVTADRHQHAEDLLRQLYEPRDRGPHGLPHLIGGTQEPASLEPERRPTGERNTARLACWLDAPPAPGRLSPPRRPIWHCMVRTDPRDRPLSDAQWRQVASDITGQAGLATPQPGWMPRWVAARHGRDHVHIIAVLPGPAGIRYERRLLALVRAACRDAEDRYGLASARHPAPSPAVPVARRGLACRDD